MSEHAMKVFFRWLENAHTTDAEILARRPRLLAVIERGSEEDAVAARRFLRALDAELQARADLARFLGS